MGASSTHRRNGTDSQLAFLLIAVCTSCMLFGHTNAQGFDFFYFVLQVSDLKTQLQAQWDSLACPSSDGTSFWTHEWDKHGTCCESIFSTQHAYFQAALNLIASVDPLGALSAAGIQPDDTSYSLTAIKNALSSSIGHLPGVECNTDASGNRQLYQLYICVDTDGATLIDCPVFPSSGCPATVIFPSF